MKIYSIRCAFKKRKDGDFELKIVLPKENVEMNDLPSVNLLKYCIKYEIKKYRDLHLKKANCLLNSPDLKRGERNKN